MRMTGHAPPPRTHSARRPQDFSGFRLLVLLPRERVMWPAPGQYDKPEARKHAALGAPLDPLPALQVKGKPLSAATIRTGPGYIEVPFVATHENKRGRGFGRCVVEAIEEVARALGVGKLLLCSTCETSVSATWRHLGFEESSEALLRSWDVEDTDLVHMQNTLQMHKLVPPARRWRPLVIRHQAFVARVYMPADRRALSGKSQRSARPGRHDMGAASGYGRSSRATSAATTGGGSLSNASYGGGDEQQDGGDEQQQPQPRQAAAAAAQQQLLLAAPPLALPEQQPVDEQQQQAVQQPMDGMLIDQHHHHHHQQALGGPLLLNGPGGHYGGAPQPQPQSPTLVDEAMPAAMMMMDTGAGLI